MREDGPETFTDTDSDARAGIHLVVNQSWPPGFFRSLFRTKRHKNRTDGCDDRWNSEQPTPIAFGNGPCANGKACKNQRGQLTDGDLAQLDHKAIDAGERSTLIAIEPCRVDLDHARGAEGLEIPVHQPNQRERGECPRKRCKAIDQINDDRAGGANQHRRASADTIRDETIDELAYPVSEGPGTQNARNLERTESVFRYHSGRGEPKIVPAHVVRGVHEPEADPIQATAGSKSPGIFITGARRGCSDGLFHEFSFANTRAKSTQTVMVLTRKSQRKCLINPFSWQKERRRPDWSPSPLVDRPL
jgi:hypothetical protein